MDQYRWIKMLSNKISRLIDENTVVPKECSSIVLKKNVKSDTSSAYGNCVSI